TEGGWAMAGDALDGDVRRLRYSGRGGGNGDPLGYRPVRAEGDGGGSGGAGGGVSESAFHLTPLDVRKQEFRKSLRGYEPVGAEAEARRVLDAAGAAKADVERQAAEVQRQYQQYVGGFRALLERQLAELRALDGQHGG